MEDFDEWARRLPKWSEKLLELGASWDTFERDPEDIVADLLEGGIPLLSAKDIVNKAREALQSRNAPLAVFWDLDTIFFPPGCTGRYVISCLKSVLSQYGMLYQLRGYASNSFVSISEQNRCVLIEAGCIMIDSPGGWKEVASKRIIIDSLTFASEHPQRATICLVTADPDMTHLLSALYKKQWKTILVSNEKTLYKMPDVVCGVKLNWEYDILHLQQISGADISEGMMIHSNNSGHSPLTIASDCNDQNNSGNPNLERDTSQHDNKINTEPRQESSFMSNGEIDFLQVFRITEEVLVQDRNTTPPESSLMQQTVTIPSECNTQSNENRIEDREITEEQLSTFSISESRKKSSYIKNNDIDFLQVLRITEEVLTQDSNTTPPLESSVRQKPHPNGNSIFESANASKLLSEKDVNFLRMKISEAALDLGNGQKHSALNCNLRSLLRSGDPEKFPSRNELSAFLEAAAKDGLTRETGYGEYKIITIVGTDGQFPTPPLPITKIKPPIARKDMPQKVTRLTQTLPYIIFAPWSEGSKEELPSKAFTHKSQHWAMLMFETLLHAQQAAVEFPWLNSGHLIDWRKSNEDELPSMPLTPYSIGDKIFTKKANEPVLCQDAPGADVDTVVRAMDMLLKNDELYVSENTLLFQLASYCPRSNAEKLDEFRLLILIDEAVAAGLIRLFKVTGLPHNYCLPEQFQNAIALCNSGKIDTSEEEKHVISLLISSNNKFLNRTVVMDSLKSKFRSMESPWKRVRVFQNGKKKGLFFLAKSGCIQIVGLSFQDARRGLKLTEGSH